MISSINDDELQKLSMKLFTLQLCMNIKKLGYDYKPNQYIITTTQELEGWTVINEVEVIEAIIEPSIGAGYCDYTCNVKDDLIKIGAKIPHSVDDEEVMGFTININSELTQKIIDSNIDVEQIMSLIANQIDYEHLCFEESTVQNSQIIIDRKYNTGIYIIVPVTYVATEWFIITYTELLEKLHKKANFTIDKSKNKEID